MAPGQIPPRGAGLEVRVGVCTGRMPRGFPEYPPNDFSKLIENLHCTLFVFEIETGYGQVIAVGGRSGSSATAVSTLVLAS